MAPTLAQKRQIEDLDAGGMCSEDGAPISVGFGERMSDLQFVEVPLSELKTPRRTSELVAGPGASPTVHVRTASCKVTVVDRTNWPIKGATVEVWSQILGQTNSDGLYDSPLFFAGDYPVKVRGPFVGRTAGGPDDAVIPAEVAQDNQFLDGASTLTIQVGLAGSGLSPYERAVQIFSRAIPKAPHEAKEQLKGMISPFSIGIMITLAGLWVASHFVVVGEAADLIVAAGAAIKLGLSLALAKQIVVDLLVFLTGILVAKNEYELDEAAGAVTRVVVNLASIALTKVAESAIKKGVRNSYRPKGIPDEVTTEPPRSPTVGEAMQSKLGKRLGSVMGDATFEERLKGIEDCAKADPTLTQIPVEDAASLRGYTSHKVTELGRAIDKPDYVVLNKALRDRNGVVFGKAVEYIDSILRAYNRFPQHGGKSFRGFGIDHNPGFADGLKPGKPYRDLAFFSSSLEESRAKEYMLNISTAPEQPSTAPPKKAVMFHVKGYSSRVIQSLTEVKKDKEALFRPGTYFLIVKKWVEPVTTKFEKVDYVTEVVHMSIIEINESAKDFVSVWGTAGALVANIRALQRWYEKNEKSAKTTAPVPAAAY